MRIETARDVKVTPEVILNEDFKDILRDEWITDALFTNSSFRQVIGVAPLPIKAPVVLELLKIPEVAALLNTIIENGSSLLLLKDLLSSEIKLYLKDKQLREIEIPSQLRREVAQVLKGVTAWAGELNQDGEHVIDLQTPVPGPHFNVNLLLGKRIGYPYPLQTTPKSVVDRLGGGSFRSHAATQVLATRWDLRQEENGFPANRQFYLLENGHQIFYSAKPDDPNIQSARCIHSRNYTTIEYETKCGLIIRRIIFILPQLAGMPLATEVQRIEIENHGRCSRKLRLVYTGMFGSAAPLAVFEDVLYSNIVMQAKVLKDNNGDIVALGPEYYPNAGKEDLRFHTMLIRQDDKFTFPTEFCINYNEFVGNGTLENPMGLFKLSNNLYRKGPGFFAMAGTVEIHPDDVRLIDNFTGLVSKKGNPGFHDGTFQEEIANLATKFSKPEAVAEVLTEIRQFNHKFSNYAVLESSDTALNTYFNMNLPFQILYQTFVSRSFCQTQKGYREIGFREIQDLFASMQYFWGMGHGELIKDLLQEWCVKVFEFGYAYHNFFWEGKEAGKWSDDALWLVQAIYRYLALSGDLAFLDQEYEMAGTPPEQKRLVYDTIKAILQYSGEISIGKHGLPLLDNADWNDCLRLDADFCDGKAKEKRYRDQLARGGTFGEPLESNYSESVMNGFLLKVAIEATLQMARAKNDTVYEDRLRDLSGKLQHNLQEHAWKGDFFARVLFNRYPDDELSYLGAGGDQLSADPAFDGVYFLNSFSWALLSETATEDQTRIMLKTVEKVLKTPFGLKLMSPANLSKVTKNAATDEYFPGDRENGAVFKHACMMATAAMFKAAKEVTDIQLAIELNRLAYWMIDLTVPYRTMSNPFAICGNPRFCTQYNNSETGENIGPMLSGTATWLNLSLLAAFGVEHSFEGIIINPLLREEETTLSLTLNLEKTSYKIKVEKPLGFYRMKDQPAELMLDHCRLNGNTIPIFNDATTHLVDVIFRSQTKITS